MILSIKRRNYQKCSQEAVNRDYDAFLTLTMLEYGAGLIKE
jgi:hypothetical protein